MFIRLLLFILAIPCVISAQHHISSAGPPKSPEVKYNSRVRGILYNLGDDTPRNVRNAIAVFERIMGANMKKVHYIKAPMDSEARSFIDWISGDVGTYDVVDQPTFTPYKHWEGHPTGDDTEIHWDNYKSPPRNNVSISVMLLRKDSRATDNHRLITTEDGSHIEEDNAAGHVQYRAHGVGTSTWSGGVLKDTAVYTTRRIVSTTQEFWENSTLVDSDLVDSQPTQDGTIYVGNNGTHAREHNGLFGFVVVGEDYDIPTLVKAIHAYLAIVSYSPESHDIFENIQFDTLSVEPWRRDVGAGIVDGFQNLGLLHRIVNFNRYGMITPERALIEWMSGRVSSVVGTPLFVQSLGYQTDITSAINSNFIPDKSPEDLTYIVMGQVLSNDVNENYLIGADDGNYVTFIKAIQGDSINFVGSAHATGLLGYWDSGFTNRKIISVTTEYPNTLMVRTDSKVLRRLTRTHGGIPQVPLYVGGNNANGTLTEGSEFIAEYFIAIRGKLNAYEMDSIAGILNWANDLWQENAPVGPTAPEGDNTAPTVPGITFNSKGSNFISFDITTPSTDANAFNYNVERDQTFDFQVTQGATNVIVPNLTPSTEYDLRINAEDISGNISGYSNEITITTDAVGGGAYTSMTEDFEGAFPSTTEWTHLWEVQPQIITDPTNGNNKVLHLVVETPNDGNALTEDEHTQKGARQEFEKRTGAASTPPKFPAWYDRVGVSFRILFPNSHDWDDRNNIVFHQWHHQAQHPIEGGVPISLRVQDEDNDNDGDIKARLRWADVPCDAQGNPQLQPNDATDVGIGTAASFDMSKNTWYYFVVDFLIDYRQGGDGFLKVYMKSGAPPTAADIAINYNGPLGFGCWPDNTVYLKMGMYHHTTRNWETGGGPPDGGGVWYMQDQNIDRATWYLDDFYFQYGSTLLSE